jgi:glycosyltransferase involved in cell wall biosynthesis
VEAAAQTLARGLALLGLEITVFVPGSEADVLDCDGAVKVRRVRRGPGPGALRYWSVDAWRVACAVRENSPDLVHVQGAAGSALFLSSSPRVHTVHGIAHLNLLHSRERALSSRAAAALVKAVERLARMRMHRTVIINPYVLEAYPDLRGRLTYEIPNALDDTMFATPPAPATQRAGRISIVGRICENKRTLETILAFQQLARRKAGMTLSVVGQADDAAYNNACKEAARNGPGQVVFAGHLDRPDLVKCLDATAILAVPSAQETAPMVIAEAHARGVFVVASDLPGLRRMIRPGIDGLLLADASVPTLMQTFNSALEIEIDVKSIHFDAASKYRSSEICLKTELLYRSTIGALQ